MTATNPVTPSPSSVNAKPPLIAARPGRLLSLDILRGLTIALSLIHI